MQAPNLRFPKSFQQLLQPLNLSCHRWGQQASRIRFQHLGIVCDGILYLGARLRSGVIAHRPLVSPLPLAVSAVWRLLERFGRPQSLVKSEQISLSQIAILALKRGSHDLDHTAGICVCTGLSRGPQHRCSVVVTRMGCACLLLPQLTAGGCWPRVTLALGLCGIDRCRRCHGLSLRLSRSGTLYAGNRHVRA